MPQLTETTPITASKEQLSALQALLSRQADAREWFDEMTGKAEPEFRHVALKFRGLHVEQADRIAAIITAVGGDPDGEGGLRSVLRRASVSVRAAVSEIDGEMLDRVEDTEAEILAAFDHAISGLPASRYRDELQQMKGEVMTLMDETRGEDAA